VIEQRAVPDSMRWGRHIHSLRDLINHHARDEAWVPDVLDGRTAEEVGARHDGDLLGSDPGGSFARLVAIGVEAVERFSDLNRVVHLSYGDFPAHEYLLHVTIFRGLGAYDIAKLTGTDSALPAEVADDLVELVAPHAEALRAMGVFGPEIELAAGASAQDRLLALTGRDPAL
jgi:uncharacterized protein (TIGR03086 family)